jgi:gas vesicle protein
MPIAFLSSTAAACGIQLPESTKLPRGIPFGTIRQAPATLRRNSIMSEETQSSQSSGFSWFLAGLGIGALIGVLYAPKAGRETREELASSAREGTEYLRQRSKEAADQINQIVDRGKAQVSEYVERGKEYVDRSRAQWDDFVAQGRQFVTEQTEKVSAAVDAGKEAYHHTAATGENQSTTPS